MVTTPKKIIKKSQTGAVRAASKRTAGKDPAASCAQWELAGA